MAWDLPEHAGSHLGGSECVGERGPLRGGSAGLFHFKARTLSILCSSSSACCLGILSELVTWCPGGTSNLPDHTTCLLVFLLLIDYSSESDVLCGNWRVKMCENLQQQWHPLVVVDFSFFFSPSSIQGFVSRDVDRCCFSHNHSPSPYPALLWPHPSFLFFLAVISSGV